MLHSWHQESRFEPRQALKAEQDFNVERRRSNSLEHSIEASFDKEQEEVKRVRSLDRGNIGAHARPHTMGVGGLRPVGFPVGTRVGSSHQGKSLTGQPSTHPPPEPASTHEWLKL